MCENGGEARQWVNEIKMRWPIIWRSESLWLCLQCFCSPAAEGLTPGDWVWLSIRARRWDLVPSDALKTKEAVCHPAPVYDSRATSNRLHSFSHDNISHLKCFLSVLLAKLFHMGPLLILFTVACCLLEAPAVNGELNRKTSLHRFEGLQ